MNNGQNHKTVAKKLCDLAQILEGEPLPVIVERRANDLRCDLAALRREYRHQDQDLEDFLKSVAWVIECMTIEGRTAIICGAKEAAAELNNKHEPGPESRVSWQDIARLPANDRESLNRAAKQLRHLAGLLSERTTATILPEEHTAPTTVENWFFQHGQATYNDIIIPINGIRWKLLKAFVENDGPLTVNDLSAAGWEHDEEVDPATLRTHLSEIRKLLRRKLNKPDDFDPLPRRDRGSLLAWKLHADLR